MSSNNTPRELTFGADLYNHSTNARRTRNLFVLWLGIFLLTLLHRHHVMHWPPYTEQVISHWTEADWLVDNHFDIHSLRIEELHFEDGGPRVYWCTIVSPLLAIAMLLFNPPTLIVLYHLLIWMFSAWALAVSFDLIRPLYKSPFLPFLFISAIYFTPIYSVQTEMLGMDIPMTACSLLWWRAMHQKRYQFATVLAILPFFVKPSAFIVPQAAAGYLGILSVLNLALQRLHASFSYFIMVVAHTIIFTVQMFLLIYGGNLRGRLFPFQDIGVWINSSPDLLIVIAFTIVLLCIRIIFSLVQIMPSLGHLRSFIDLLESQIGAQPLLWTGSLVTLLNLFAATLTYYESRHLTLIVPFLFVMISHLTSRWQAARGFMVATLLIYISAQCINQHGVLYPTLTGYISRGFGILERSLEYRRDLQSNWQASQLLDQIGHDESVLAMEQFIYFLRRPRMGYVQKAFGSDEDAFSYIVRDDMLLRLSADQPESILVTYVTPQIGERPFPAYQVSPPRDGDEILFNDQLNPPTIIYRRRFPKLADPADQIRQYVDLVFDNARRIDPAIRLAVAGQASLAYRYIAAEQQKDQPDDAVRLSLITRIQDFAAEIDRQLKIEPHNIAVETLSRVLHYRLSSFTKGEPLPILSWKDRTWIETWAQRIQYYPPASEHKGHSILSEKKEPGDE